MATFKPVIGKIKQDKTYPVSIQVTHKRLKRYIPQETFLIKSQLTNKLKIKDDHVKETLDITIKGYRKKLLGIQQSINDCSVDDIKSFLLAKEEKYEAIDFIKFGKEFAATQTDGTAGNTIVAINRLVDFLGRSQLDIKQINLPLLKNFEKYLKSDRPFTRIHRSGTKTKVMLKAIGDSTVSKYMSKISQIYLEAQNTYNDDELNIIRIPYHPFAKYKAPKAKPTRKRNLKSEIIISIRDAKYLTKQQDMARDVFMLSFYLVGINTVDLFNLTDYKDGRIIYKRQKTASRKDDLSILSIKVEPEAEILIKKYADPTGKRLFNFYNRFANKANFNECVNRGLKSLSTEVKIEPITFYWARHSWSTIARNICRVPKEDIHFALNHSDPDMKITDIYIEEDFSIIDEANRKVLDTLL